MNRFSFGNPFFRNPYYNYYTCNSNYKNHIDNYFDSHSKTLNHETIHSDLDSRNSKGTNSVAKKTPPKNNSFPNFNISSIFSSDIETPIVEILGLELYLDDILIILLLFFLYSEGVKDEMLFLCLILLLLG